MFDINTAINTAIAAAVAEATKPLIERITTLETKLAEAALFERTTEVTVPVDEAKLAEALNSQEWFWEEISRYITNNSNITVDELHNIKQRLSDAEDRLDKITTASDERIQGMVERAIEQHCEEYDHDDMVMKDDIPDMDDYIKREDLDSEVHDAVRDVMEAARVHISF